MDKLAEQMLDGGVLTKAQLETVLQQQRVFGGSLALNLLIEGAVSERVVQVFLEQVIGNPGKQPYNSEPDPDVLALLDRDRAARLKCIPLKVEDNVLHVLTIDPSNKEALLEIDKRTGYEVVPSLVNELRFLWLLDRWYGIVCPPRAEEAAKNLSKNENELMKSILDSDDEDSLIYDPMAGAFAGMEGLESLVDSNDGAGQGETMEVEEEIFHLLEEELSSLVMSTKKEEHATLQKEEKRSDLPVGEGLEPLEMKDVPKALEEALSLDDVFEVFERYGGPYFKSLTAFRVQGGVIMGWKSVGTETDPEVIRELVVPVSEEVFLTEAMGEEPHLSVERNSPSDKKLAAQMGCDEKDTILCFRIIVLTRPVVALCANLQENIPLPKVVGEFADLCEKASSAVVRIIMKKKEKKKRATKQKPKNKSSNKAKRDKK